MKSKKNSPKPKTANLEPAPEAAAPKANKKAQGAAPVIQKAAATPIPKPKRKTPEIPPVLLEGDQPAPLAGSGPGSRYVLGPKSSAALNAPNSLGELPESYGTQRVLAAARDPHWLYVSWDLSKEQLRKYNEQSIHGHLVVRIQQSPAQGEPHAEVHVHPESRNWFVYVGQAVDSVCRGTGFLPSGRAMAERRRFAEHLHPSG